LTAPHEIEHAEGHDWIYRLTTLTETPESRYYLSAHEARAWRGRLREAGFPARVDRAPASAFARVTDAELDESAAAEAAKHASN
jgi:hypothetical protein